MAKDPAFLFYSSDFLVGTMLMSNEDVGKYIRLICLAHQKGGYLTEEDMFKICNTSDKDVISKFKIDGDGIYYNERLLSEINKRSKYSESRRNNRIKKEDKKTSSHDEHMNNICKTYDKHMENENVNINIIKDKDIISIKNKEIKMKKNDMFTKPTLEELNDFILENVLNIDAQHFIDYYESNGWKVGKNAMKSWKATARNWDRNQIGKKQSNKQDTIKDMFKNV